MMENSYCKTIIQQCERLGIKPTNTLIYVSIGEQCMHVRDGTGDGRRTYRVSTSSRPPSCRQDSLGTPTGLHCIADKIGGDQPPGMVFRGRRPIGCHYRELPESEQSGNLITSRILRLRGLEPGHNNGDGCDSYDRFIYIHGTNHEDRIGTPQSAGCVLLTNRDVIDLFHAVEEDTIVLIGD